MCTTISVPAIPTLNVIFLTNSQSGFLYFQRILFSFPILPRLTNICWVCLTRQGMCKFGWCYVNISHDEKKCRNKLKSWLQIILLLLCISEFPPIKSVIIIQPQEKSYKKFSTALVKMNKYKLYVIAWITPMKTMTRKLKLKNTGRLKGIQFLTKQHYRTLWNAQCDH